jgi:hypothetical protein
VELKSANSTSAVVNDSEDTSIASGDGKKTTADMDMNNADDSDMASSLVNIVTSDPSKDIVAQYVTLTDPKSKLKRVVTVMHPIGSDFSTADASQNVEVEGEVIMNINEALEDDIRTAHGIKAEEFEPNDVVHHVLHNTSNPMVSIPTDTVSMTFTIPKDSDYSQDGDPDSAVSFMDPDSSKEFSVSLPHETLVNLLNPAIETEVVSSDCMLSEGGATLVSLKNGTIVSLSDAMIMPHNDDGHGFVSVVETVETMEEKEQF